MKHIKTILCLSLLMTLLGASETYANKFLFTSFGTGYAHVKDPGTSPLRYRGASAELNGSYLQESNKNTIDILVNVRGMLGFAAQNNLTYFSEALDITYLHTLPFFPNSSSNLRLGGNMNISMRGMVSPAYQNAAFNIDMMVKLALSARLEHKINIAKQQINVLGLKFNIREQSYSPYVRMDVPMLTFNGRPEYPYVNENDLGIFDRHYFFGGLYLATEIGIKKHLPNGNMIGLAYDWEMFSSGKKDIYLFESGFHQLVLSLYFKLN